MPFDMSDPEATIHDLGNGSQAGWLVPIIYAVCAVAFIDDLQRGGDTLAYGIFYVPLIATAVFHRRPEGLWVLTTVASLLVVIGALVPFGESASPDLIGNRVLSILAILATAGLVRHARRMQDRLIAATRRAEQAEHMKAEVVNNLSQELRTPLHSLIGLLSLMMLQCRPDQKAALRTVQAGGKELLATIDNLVDLTQIHDRALHRQPVPMATILRQAADSARCIADETGVTIVVDVAGGEVCAVGDAWATRRILDNLIANAVRFSPPGGIITLAVDQASGQVTASVRDAAQHLPPELLGLAPDQSAPMPDAAGLTLSSRLTQAMDGSLVLDSARASLRLPALVQDAA